MEERTYLGDGVSIAVTGMGFALTTSDGISITNEIVLDERVYAALRDYCDRVLAGEKEPQ